MKYKLTQLASGLRVLTVPIANLESATVTVWIGVGSRSETNKIAGLSHFLEHMVFKGSKTRPSAKEIAEAVDSIGAEFNAATSKEWTNFYIKTPSGNIKTAFDVLSDMVLNPILKEEDVEREKGVIIEEIGMYEDTPLWKISDLFENVIFQGGTLGRDIIGSRETVKGIKKSDFVRYRKLHYSSENMLITVAGGFNEKEAIKLANKYFKEINVKGKEKIKKFENKQKKPRLLLSTQDKEQAHFILGFHSGKRGNKDKYAESLLSAVMGGGMSSRLFTEVREKRGLAYSVKTSRETYADTGYIEVYAGVDTKRADEAIKVVIDQCYGIASGKYELAESELDKAKEYIKGHIALSLEDTKNVNSFFGIRQLLLGKVETSEEIFRGIDRVTPEEVIKVAKKVFKPQNLNLAIIGPFKNKKKFERIIN